MRFIGIQGVWSSGLGINLVLGFAGLSGVYTGLQEIGWGLSHFRVLRVFKMYRPGKGLQCVTGFGLWDSTICRLFGFMGLLTCCLTGVL